MRSPVRSEGTVVLVRTASSLLLLPKSSGRRLPAYLSRPAASKPFGLVCLLALQHLVCIDANGLGVATLLLPGPGETDCLSERHSTRKRSLSQRPLAPSNTLGMAFRRRSSGSSHRPCLPGIPPATFLAESGLLPWHPRTFVPSTVKGEQLLLD